MTDIRQNIASRTYRQEASFTNSQSGNVARPDLQVFTSTVSDSQASRLRRLHRQRQELISWLNLNPQPTTLQTRVRATLKRINRAIAVPELGVECRPIPGFPGYEATSDGRILFFDWNHRKPARIVNQYGGVRPGDPFHVGLNFNGKRTITSVQRVIAMAFHGESQAPRIYVRNIDGNILNNRADNLVWATNSQGPIKLELSRYSTRAHWRVVKDLQERFPELTQVCDHTHGTSRLTELYRQQEQIEAWLAQNPDGSNLRTLTLENLQAVNDLVAKREAIPSWPVTVARKARAA